ncbi:hypothetical protein BST95_02170 [Halioglobus japonicus]|uniref:Uncharacterized protein n=1 Tax=Halioglobus japonicus TaxID=930805 RepID=A0AAP8MCA0_9GAMM|nr:MULTISPECIES: hypothetical protein [Halioglobus]AQA17200.1 hypothetical protein BST95_02170 [Halioglobus japonicus]KZX58240.1 hypothetical protein A3709_01885 [Halioglobus sp. HI00S01]PLW85115.1 hypothetical protein C0029_16435 [Halioglobus japonicus]GHD19523.1 hypothetical protein GCM10007052_28150 [Halioglobus japonicus]
MGERNQEPNTSEPLEDMFEPGLGDMSDEDLAELAPLASDKQRLAEKRRRAEQRLEEKRLRDELGYYDLELDDF